MRFIEGLKVGFEISRPKNSCPKWISFDQTGYQALGSLTGHKSV